MSPRKALRNTDAIVVTSGDKVAVVGPLSRDCPTCKSPAGRKCVRVTGGRVRGEDVGGSYAVPLTQPHAARRKWTPAVEVDADDEAAAEATMHLPYVNLTAEGMAAVGVCADELSTTKDDVIDRAVIYYARYVMGLM